MSQKYDYIIYSDGGSSSLGLGGCAAIIEPSSGERVKLVCHLGKTSDAESEIMGGILGFSYLSIIKNTDALSVKWFCDNQVVVDAVNSHLLVWQNNKWQTKSGSPVKNRSLWQIFLALTESFSITVEHVPAHSGDRFNEACDRACCWMIDSGDKLLDKHGEGRIGKMADINPAHAWLLLDGRDVLTQNRNDPSTGNMLAEKLSKILA